MDKFPPEIVLQITSHLSAFETYHFLIAYLCWGLCHDLRPHVSISHQDGSVALYHAIRMGRLDLMKEIPNIRQLIKAIDNFTSYPGQHHEDCYFAGKERQLQRVASAAISIR
ncbi:hypothetical protein PENSUB_4867 [Penicillium subrubescens]|uniref:Uncharacterized protein n=1 Tax=Penicillium subrubescens TaxID=1316194 RepID=A0A1Q5UB92_9EURO|nr:hypothetical protein PENSUB_4867 [Penicillium subrubescens]